MKPISAQRIIKVLVRHGFTLSRQRGSHRIYRHAVSGIIVPVPMHGGNKPIPIGTLIAIVKQSKIPKLEFR